MMLNRTLLLSVIAAVLSASLLFGQSPSATADAKVNSPNVKNTVILGQESANNSPSLGTRFRQMINRFLQDDEEATPRPENRSTPVVVQPAVPTQPPKPLTAAEVQQSATTANPRRTAVATPPQRQQESDGRQTPLAVSRSTANNNEEIDSAEEDSIHARMNKYRRAVLANPSLEEAAIASRQLSSSPALTPSPSSSETGNTLSRVDENSNRPAESIPIPPVPAAQTPAVAEPLKEPAPAAPTAPTEIFQNPQTILRSDNPVVIEHVPAEQTAPLQNTEPQNTEPAAPQETAQPVAITPTEQPQFQDKQLVVSESPRFGIEIEKPPVSILGQEVTYRIRFSNTGNVPIEQVVLTAEIPSWIDIGSPETNSGKAESLPREGGSGMSDLVWKISRVEPGTTDLLILRLVPQQQRSIELLFNCDYYRPAIITKVEVQEPKLELELLGADEVLWNDLVVYTLLVRNVGNGNANDLKLTLQQSNSDAAQCEFEEPLRPGEEQPIAISVQAGKEQEFIDIAVNAEGAHDLKGEIKRRIKVLRPKLEMTVQTPAFHFVDSVAEFVIRVRNMGTADAENMTIRAELPLGAQYDTSSNGGMLTTQDQQSVVEWRGCSIMRGETQTFMLTCLPKREGECRISVETSTTDGNVLASGNSTFTAEAFGELDLMVLKPKGHVELGQEAEYTIQVTNIGTKAAENVEVLMAFGWKEGTESVAVLEPINVAGGEASLYNGMVSFEKIPVILPKQSVELKVIAKAEQAGTVPIKTQVSGQDITGSVGSELSTTVYSRRTRVATSTDSSSENEIK